MLLGPGGRIARWDGCLVKASTHMGFASLMYLVFFTSAGFSLSAANAATVALASVLPDIDTGGSYAGRLCPPLTRFIERKYGHRTLTHSLFIMALFVLVSLVPILAGCGTAACFLLGYGSHPFLDTCTPNGVRLFFPFSRLRCVFPFDGNAPHRFRIESGSKLDAALGVLLWLACIPALYVADMGYERFIRLTQHSVESAVRDYESFSPTAVVCAVMKARNALSGEIIEGRFPVAGALNPHTLVFVGADGRLHTVGKDFEADYTAEHIVCEKGEPATIAVRQLDMRYQVLGVLASEEGESYCLGEVATAFDVSFPLRPRAFSPVEGRGKRLRLTFARKSDIEDLGLGGMLATSGTVLVRSVVRRHEADSLVRAQCSPAGGTLITCVLNPGETIECRKLKGETVAAGDTLALRIIPAFYREEAALNDRKRVTAREHDRAALEDLDRTIAAAEEAARADSIEHANAEALATRGYIAGAAVGKSLEKWQKSRRALRRLVSNRALLMGRSALEQDRLRLASEQLRSRASVQALRCEVLAPAPGTLVEIRRDQSGGKEKVSFVIRSGPP